MNEPLLDQRLHLRTRALQLGREHDIEPLPHMRGASLHYNKMFLGRSCHDNCNFIPDMARFANGIPAMENPVADKMVTATCEKCGNLIDVTGLEPGDGITCPYCSHQFAITRQFGNFMLERQLGAGGMGAVYLGRDLTLNRTVAVKVLKPELVSDEKFLNTFLREAEITASLNHPNIVQVFAFGQHEGIYYMVVELISAGSLDDRIAERGQITELEGIEIGIAVARGLECALQRGNLIHRDIKPGNILFNQNNTPKVVDFGLSLSHDTMDHFDGEI